MTSARFVKINGEAIYGSRAWKVFGEGRMRSDPRHPGSKPSLVLFPRTEISPQTEAVQMTTEDMRFTEGRNGAVYAFVMTIPKPGETITIKSLGTKAKLLESPSHPFLFSE